MKIQVGDKYGRLTIIEILGDRWFRCLCDCRNQKDVFGTNLRRTVVHTRSCGCLRTDGIGEGNANFNRLYKTYRRAAEDRGYKFSLTSVQFKEFTQQNCNYCGAPPNRAYKVTGASNGDYVYNGIDRVDNTKGYDMNNCVTCCKTCNIAKSDMTVSEFRDWLDQVILNWKGG